MADQQPDLKTLKMVLLGKTGAGKSASGNTILGERRFEAKTSPSSVTTKCSTGERILGEQKLIVVDTPGLFNTKHKLQDTMMELVDFLLSIVPGQMPDAFLWVIECDNFTGEVAKSIQIFKKVFESATEHTIVLFTNGKEEDVKAFIEADQTLKGFINECNGLYQVFDNKDTKDKKQVLELVEKINNMVKKNGKPYSSELLEKAKKATEELKNQHEEQTVGDSDYSIRASLKRFIDIGVDNLDQALPGTKAFLELVQKMAKECCV